MKTEEIKALDIKTLLSNGDEYVIPIYQRNYAWQAKEIEQLIQDILDYSLHHKDKNYYIGTLVVANLDGNGSKCYNTIDGQQRLTTLTILTSAIKRNFSHETDLTWFNQLNLSFASRQRSGISLKAAFEGKFLNENYEANIRNAYDICIKELDKKLSENKLSIKEFTKYLYQYVKILRVPLPNGLDLNHYFEIMNSRGEQLEKHEILKAKLMSVFNELPDRSKYETAFDLIWEACSNMEKYVQYGFSVEQRHIVFGDKNWNSFNIHGFDDFINKLLDTLNVDNSNELNIDSIIDGTIVEEKEEETEEIPDRFNSVVNFQNFLLHVLRVQLKKDEIALDDKRLIEIFDNEMRGKNVNEKIEFAKEFIYNLLKSKFLFDKFVIKREFTANTDRWSLKSAKWYSSGKTKNGVKYTNTFGEESTESFDNDNRKILMLLSMFHVSIPSMSYKYWLNASLNYLMEQVDVDSKDYISYLEHIVKSFVYDRFLAKAPLDYYTMIHLNKGPISRASSDLNFERLKYKAIENNLLFNYCDYLLWIKLKKEAKDQRIKSFEYTFRSSVEHYYPQTPINPSDAIDEKFLHLFGNLCLISHEKNSRLNNLLPAGKKDHYRSAAAFDSLKQYIMMERNPWGIAQIEEHDAEMKQLLLDNINSEYKPNTEISKAAKWFNEYKVRDRNLLVRALLCFGDYAEHDGGERYYLYNFDLVRNNECFLKFEEYINKKNPKDLFSVIQANLKLEPLKKRYEYLFIKYPEVIDYCKEGKFTWNEASEGKLVHLLEGSKKTVNKAKELLSYILSLDLERRLGQPVYTDYECLCINIGYENEKYFVTEYNKASVQLQIWNEAGKQIMYCIEPMVNGNSSAVKMLEEYKWEKLEDGCYARFGKMKLIGLEGDFEEIISTSLEEVYKLLKNGLKINL